MQRSARLLLTLCAKSATARPSSPEALGNKLQRLALQRPAFALVLEEIVAEMLAQLNR